MSEESSTKELLDYKTNSKKKGEKLKSFLKYFLFTVVIFFFSSIFTLGGLAYYIYKKNPLNIQACMISSVITASLTPDIDNLNDSSSTGIDATKTSPIQFDHPFLSSEQELSLEKAGIDVGTLPTSLSPEMKACGTEALGAERINEIINGSTPGLLEVVRLKSCL